MSPARIPILLLTTLAIGCDGAPALPPHADRNTPNIILIVVDTLRADHLSQYGYALPTSDALSLLTSRATRFEECYSPAAWTAPAVASLLTGLAPAHHNVDRIGAAVGDEIETLAETLRDAGWDTAAFSFNPHVSRKSRFDQGFNEFIGYRGSAKRAPDIRALTREAWQWIDEEAHAPFFLYMQPMNVHGPYRVPEDAEQLLLGRAPIEGFEFFGPLMKELMNKGQLERREDVTETFLSSLQEKYDTAIRHTAEELSIFFERLDEAGLFDDALIVLTADHGEELFDHGGFAHRYSLHREVLHVPLFVKLPGQRTSRVVSEPVSLIDVHTTLLEWLAVKTRAQRRTDGVSLVPFLDEHSHVPETLAGRSFLAQATNRKRCVGRALRHGRYALLEIERSYESDRPHTRLYDLIDDPSEQHDLSRSEPSLRARLRLAMREHIDRAKGDEFPAVAYDLSEQERAALDALGYAEGEGTRSPAEGE